MRQAILSSRTAQFAAQPGLVSRAAPVKGWNTRDPVARLNSLYAQVLDNFYPVEGAVSMRTGREEWATGATGGTRTLLSFNTNTGSGSKLLAVSDAGIFDATAGGALGAAVHTLTNGLFEAVNITNSAGTNFIWGCNGVDKVAVSSDGTTWTALDGASTPAITGVTTTDLNWCWLFKRRIFAVVKNSMKCAYGPVDSIAGVFSTINLGAIFSRGGYLLSGANWTIDGGNGPDDYCVFITSEGEVAVYQGINPASAASWGLVGVFFAGRPASRRCFVPYGGDLVVNTELGLIPISRLIANKLLQPSEALSDTIRPTFTAAHRQYRTYNGWQNLVFPAQNALIANIPTSATEAVQFIMNAVTGSWCSFSGWNAQCWVVHQGLLYYGSADGAVSEAWSEDITSDEGSDIVGTILGVPERFGGTRQAQVGLFRPLVNTSGSVELRFGFVSDFDPAALTSIISRAGTYTGGVWGAGLWGVALWGGAVNTLRNWYSVSCDPGTYVAQYLQTATNDATIVQLAGIDYQIKLAGVM